MKRRTSDRGRRDATLRRSRWRSGASPSVPASDAGRPNPDAESRSRVLPGSECESIAIPPPPVLSERRIRADLAFASRRSRHPTPACACPFHLICNTLTYTTHFSCLSTCFLFPRRVQLSPFG